MLCNIKSIQNTLNKLIFFNKIGFAFKVKKLKCLNKNIIKTTKKMFMF